ncbi:MAG TPA: hypothetical protein VHZ78_16005 [Rhizomicrobium sp.]|jgi:hypothetical protein|nr:hypothetical protein [Rhizomicrobium sp.]
MSVGKFPLWIVALLLSVATLSYGSLTAAAAGPAATQVAAGR